MRMRLTSRRYGAAEREEAHPAGRASAGLSVNRKSCLQAVGANPASRSTALALRPAALDRLAVLPARCLAVAPLQARLARRRPRNVGHGGDTAVVATPRRSGLYGRREARTAPHPSGYRCVYPLDRHRDRQKNALTLMQTRFSAAMVRMCIHDFSPI